MRVTRQAKEKTRYSILESARQLFSEKGFDATTTREIAGLAKIAAGTLFNYFPSKEALGMELMAEALESGMRDFEKRKRGDESLEEDLFAFIITGLRRLEPMRMSVAAIAETALSPFAGAVITGAGEKVRLEQLETVESLLITHDLAAQPSFVAVQLYWALYLGVLAFWARDESPNQEDTLVLMDQSLKLFAASLSDNQSRTEVDHGSKP